MVLSAKDFDHGHGGNYSLESKLKVVREKIAEAAKRISELDNNMIFLIYRPDLANPSTPTSVSPIIQATYILDQSELNDQMLEFSGIKRELSLSEQELLSALRRSLSESEFHKIDNETYKINL